MILFMFISSVTIGTIVEDYFFCKYYEVLFNVQYCYYILVFILCSTQSLFISSNSRPINIAQMVTIG